MKWSPQQGEAMTSVSKWVKDPFADQVFRLFGYAGSGKTTMARQIASDIPGKVLFGAYTGKAAQVLSSKGCPANTLHQLTYVPKHKSKSRLIELQQKLQEHWDSLGDFSAEVKDVDPLVRQLKRAIAEEEENMKRMMFQLKLDSEIKDAKVLIVDECSMVDGQMGEDLLSFGTKILVLGDPAQLPPVGGGGYFTDQKPDIMLTEIHRQAEDNPIIELATKVRMGEELSVGQYGNSAVHDYGADMSEIAKSADQIICGRNKTRRAANKRVRQFLGRTSELPQTGDRMVCLRNNHTRGLLNGQIWIAATDAVGVGETYMMEAYNEDDEGSVQELIVWKDEPAWYERTEAEEFDFGYCLTCHKSQGSQWDHVMVMDESRVFRRDADKWLYTAITRAAEQVNVVKM